MAEEGASWAGEEYAVAEGTHNEHSEQQDDNLDPDTRDLSEADSGAEDDDEDPEDDDLEEEDDLEEGDEDENEEGEEGEEGDREGAEYDPESVALEPPSQVSDPSQRSASKPKMSGGFILEASDDEDDDSATPQPGASVPVQNQAQDAGASNGPAATSGLDVPPSMAAVMAGMDPITMLEARVKEDPRGDMDAWVNLVGEYKRRGRLDDVRGTYNRVVEVFPQAAEMWVDWLEMELGLDNFVDAEKLFGRCLRTVPSTRLLIVYLNYIRRRNDLTNDPSGVARQTITQSYEFVLDNVGMDRESGSIWQDYVQFVKSGPGDIRGTTWKDQQKMDQVRAIYQRGINVPMSTVNSLWKEYDQFEMSLNKATGRRFIQDKSPGYMTAKSANIALDNIMRNLKRTTLPRLPPAPGFDGDQEYREQVDLWKRWIAFEKEDPLVLENDEPEAYKKRILFCYKQALMALRFCPEIWVDAAEWCFKYGIRESERELGAEMLLQGSAANPESVLLAFTRANHVEANYPAKEGDKSEYAKAVRKPYEEVLDTLYAMGDKAKEREKLEVSTLRQSVPQETQIQTSAEQNDDEGDDTEQTKSAAEERIAAIQKGYSVETQLLSRTISYVWIAMARAMRRIQGKGNQTDGGLRKVFTDARQKGRLTSDVYVAVALMESMVYKDPVGSKIFERGARLFPNDENFMIEYLKFLHSKDDTTNARVVFETCVNRLVGKPETKAKAKPLYAYFHRYESQYGELSQISKLEDRMAELYPEDPKLSSFISRFSSDTFNPIAAPIIISKAVQMRPKQVLPTIEQPMLVQDSPMPQPQRQEQSPRPQYARATASPKRPLGIDEEDLNPPKRQARGVSPLKGAAGRRLDQQRRNQASALHRDITFLLGILPPPNTYDAQRLSPIGMVSILQNTKLPDYSTWKSQTGGQRFPPQQPTHGRQPSGDANARPLSPFARLGSASGGYRNSPLRTESGGNPYAPPEVAGPPPGWLPPPGAYGQPPPPPPAQYGGYRYQ